MGKLINIEGNISVSAEVVSGIINAMNAAIEEGLKISTNALDLRFVDFVESHNDSAYARGCSSRSAAEYNFMVFDDALMNTHVYDMRLFLTKEQIKELKKIRITKVYTLFRTLLDSKIKQITPK